MNDSIKEARPCARVFPRTTEETEKHKSKLARHGHYCDQCFYGTDKALRLAGGLVEHIVTMVGGLQSKNSDGSQRTKGQPPLPLNVDAFADANEIYSLLVYWSAVFATRINRRPPGPAARAWRTENNRIVGLPADITPAAARYAVAIMGLWLSAHLEDICALKELGDVTVSEFHDSIADVYRLSAKWPAEDRAMYAPVECASEGCGGKIAIHPPTEFKDEQKILCETCGRIYYQDDYDRMASLFRQVRKEQAQETIRAHRVAQRLAKKYA